MLTTVRRTIRTVPVLTGLTMLIASLVVVVSVDTARADDDGFVRTIADNREVTVQATKPGTTGGSSSSGASGTTTPHAKPIIAGTSTNLTPNLPATTGPTRTIFIPECWDGTLSTTGCNPTDTPTTPTRPTAPTRADAETIARTLISRLQLPTPTIQIGPDPSLNKWNMAIVGVPYWIWTDTPTTLTTQVTGYGITITLNATRTHLTIAPGDGTTLTCTTTTPYPPTTPVGAASPTCGHTYTWPSRTQAAPQGTYPLTITAHWNIHWTALGYTGDLPLTTTDTRNLPVTELHALAHAP